ncbi:uncharacterized protein LOC132261915 [Phlebotomus argentipes]|uniref:uncharacterized protein LOC132261915 n=1 Tax=Phlebotomus argentipes TaxID=94469 RepID=UPI0028937695|nr:uncharacterized protein LOC132261915 [Phlebotomus argentipes]
MKDDALLRDTTKRRIIIRALERLPVMDFQFSWTPTGKMICPSSVAQYFSNRGFTVNLCPTKRKENVVFPGRIPRMIIKEQEEPKADFDVRVAEFLEFVGLLAMDCSTKDDEFLSSYTFSGSTENTSKVTVIKWKGMFTKYLLNRVFRWLETYLLRFPAISWIVLNVEKSSGTPFVDGFSDRTFSIANDSSYAVILAPKKDYIWHQIIPIDKKF